MLSFAIAAIVGTKRKTKKKIQCNKNINLILQKYEGIYLGSHYI